MGEIIMKICQYSFYIFTLMLLMTAVPAYAYKCTPEGSFIEKKLASRTQSRWEKILSSMANKGIHIFGEPVHEEITNRILGCEGEEDICGDPEYDTDNAYVLAGVRWNDDPPFRFETGHGNFSGCDPGATIRLVTFPQCWGNVFKDGEKRAKEGTQFNAASSAPILLRSHLGDMQFLHSMGALDGELPSVTQKNMMMWAEFTWRVALEEYKLEMKVRNVPVEGMEKLFENKGWSILDLFSLGNPHVRKSKNMSEVAFGSLLHMIEDSFALSHTERALTDDKSMCPKLITNCQAPGKIVEFHSYGNQNHASHGEDDIRPAFSVNWSGNKPNVVDIGRVLYEKYQNKEKWESVKDYIECILALDEDARPATPGDAYM